MNVNIASLACAVFLRDLAIATRSGGGWFYAILFFAVFGALAGVAIGPELSALAGAAPAIVWLGAAFAIQLSVADIFEADFRDGSLRAFAAEQESLFPYFAAKAGLVAVTAAAPMVVSSPLLLTMFGVDPARLAGAAFLLALGFPALILTALFAAALAAGLRAGGLLAVIVAAPFLAPPLIFGVLAIETYIGTGMLWSPEALILLALSLFMAALAPGFSIAALRIGLE
jgi:heme exporter protein B